MSVFKWAVVKIEIKSENRVTLVPAWLNGGSIETPRGIWRRFALKSNSNFTLLKTNTNCIHNIRIKLRWREPDVRYNQIEARTIKPEIFCYSTTSSAPPRAYEGGGGGAGWQGRLVPNSQCDYKLDRWLEPEKYFSFFKNILCHKKYLQKNKYDK